MVNGQVATEISYNREKNEQDQNWWHMASGWLLGVAVTLTDAII